MSSISPAVDRMREYKGGSFPPLIVPLSGAFLGLALPYMFISSGVFSKLLASASTTDDIGNVDSVLVCLEALGWALTPLFFIEFLLGAAARSTSSRASFSPAAAAAAAVAPFEVVQTNRIHQNHIESACILVPATLAASAVGVDSAYVAAFIASWAVSRFVYRAGYCHEFPYWRICGTTASVLQSMMCFGLLVQTKL